MMKRLFLSFALTLFVSSTLAGTQNADRVLAALKEAYPKTNIRSVTETPLPGIYEVVMDRKVGYTDTSGRYFLVGSLIDMKTHTDISAEKKAELAKVDVKSLPLADAFRHVIGNGKRTLYVFSDPDCPFCKRLQPELEKLTDTTIVVFEDPIASLHPEAETKSEAIWCLKDDDERWEAWHRALMADGAVKMATCKNPIARNVVLAQSLGLKGTPTLVSDDGRVLPGMADAPSIQAWLAKSN